MQRRSTLRPTEGLAIAPALLPSAAIAEILRNLRVSRHYAAFEPLVAIDCMPLGKL
jgi:hypothetical protein